MVLTLDSSQSSTVTRMSCSVGTIDTVSSAPAFTARKTGQKIDFVKKMRLQNSERRQVIKIRIHTIHIHGKITRGNGRTDNQGAFWSRRLSIGQWGAWSHISSFRRAFRRVEAGVASSRFIRCSSSSEPFTLCGRGVCLVYELLPFGCFGGHRSEKNGARIRRRVTANLTTDSCASDRFSGLFCFFRGVELFERNADC